MITACRLRAYQDEAASALWLALAAPGNNPLRVLPTGTGKSLVIAELVRRATGQRVLVVTHVRELVGQNVAALAALAPEITACVYSAGLGRRDIGPVIFATVQSIYDKAALLG